MVPPVGKRYLAGCNRAFIPYAVNVYVRSDGVRADIEAEKPCGNILLALPRGYVASLGRTVAFVEEKRLVATAERFLGNTLSVIG